MWPDRGRVRAWAGPWIEWRGSTPRADAAMPNYKRWVLGTCNKPSADPQPHLDEFCFRSESSGRRGAAFGALLAAMMITPGEVQGEAAT